MHKLAVCMLSLMSKCLIASFVFISLDQAMQMTGGSDSPIKPTAQIHDSGNFTETSGIHVHKTKF